MAKSRLFVPFALTTAFLTIGLIIFGAVVRVTDSGLGCGNHWPLCNGTIFPPLDNITAWIEWLHRLFAMLIGVFGLVTLIIAIKDYRKQNRAVLFATIAAGVLFFVQSMLGALVVVLDLPPTFVTMHLGTSMLLVAALVVAALLAIYKPETHYPTDKFTTLAYATTALSLVIILTGALVRGSGATLACTTWPLCNGALLPIEGGQWTMIHMFHRLAVAGLGIAVVLVVWMAFSLKRPRRIKMLALAAGITYLAQAGVGAMFVFTTAAPLWGALHVLFAALTWILFVSLSVFEALNTRDISTEAAAWQSTPALN
ncbi:MAG: heme A synthase [Anaerolineae bacterium]|nr:heme A synthase [Anaerolineae bacterium]